MSWAVRMTLRIFPVLLIAYLYLGWRFSSALLQVTSLSAWTVRGGTLLVILFLNLLPLYIIFQNQGSGGSEFFLNKTSLQPADYWMNFPFWIGMVIIFESLFYILAIDIVGLIVRFLPGNRWPEWPVWQAWLTIGVVVFFTLFAGYRIYIDTYHIDRRDATIAVEGLPAGLKDFQITFTSDVQVDRYTQGAKLERYHQAVEEADSDLILFGGDLVTSGEYFIKQGQEVLCRHKAPLAKIACMGDHDYWANPRTIPAGLRDCGWSFLENDHQVLDYNGSKVLVTGVTYIYSQRISQRQLTHLLETAPEADLKILLVHQPSQLVIRTAEAYGYHLLLAGHTHGGQMVFRPFGTSLTPTRFENLFYSGTYHYGNLTTLVTNGVGRTLSPIRYRASAEIAVIRFSEK